MNQLSEIIEDSILSNVLTEDEIAEYLKETKKEEIFFNKDVLLPYLIAILVVAIVTLLTVGYKIYKVSQLNPATIIKKE